MKIKWLDQTVGAAIAYGMASFSLSRGQLLKIRSTRRSMLRRILGIKWNPEIRCYVSWISTCTAKAEELYAKCGGRDWEKQAVVQKWKWTGHVVRRTKRIPLLSILEMKDGQRGRGHPKFTWIRMFEEFLGEDWREKALDREEWKFWLGQLLHNLWSGNILNSPDLGGRMTNHIV